MSGNVLTLAQVVLSGTATTQEDAIREAAGILVAAGAVTADYERYMHEREASITTFMGNYLAIPHGTNEGKDTILASALSFVRYDSALDWGGNEVRFVVGIAGKDGGHMEVLSSIALIFSDEDSVAALLAATSAQEMFDLLGDVNE
jgi:PTS system mannitol-specific IIA component